MNRRTALRAELGDDGAFLITTATVDSSQMQTTVPRFGVDPARLRPAPAASPWSSPRTLRTAGIIGLATAGVVVGGALAWGAYVAVSWVMSHLPQIIGAGAILVILAVIFRPSTGSGRRHCPGC